MSVEPNKVKFFTAVNFGGTAVEYSAGQTVAFQPNDKYNDKFMSCIVGGNTIVNAYEHNDIYNPEPGVYKQLGAGEHKDLSNLKGLSKFQVLEVGFNWAIDVKLVTGGELFGKPSGSYKFTIIPYQVTPATCLNGDDYVQCPIPELSPPDSEIVCQIAVAETAWPGQTVANGSIYFRFEPRTGILSFRKTEGFPTNMDMTQEGTTEYIFTINSGSG